MQGGSASYDKDDRTPHLSKEDTQELLAPITVRAARRVGDILKHVPSGKKVNARFRYFT